MNQSETVSEELPEKRFKDFDRFLYLGVTVLLIFFYTRSCPYYSGQYWDLLQGREFSSGSIFMLTPEKISYYITQSYASLVGLKAIHHILFFILCSMLTILIFRGEEVIPGLILLAAFAFAMQPLLSLRDMLQLIIITLLLLGFDEERFKNSWGIAFIPLAAISSVLSLATWLILLLVFCQTLFGRDHGFSQILCVFIGTLFFIDGGLTSFTGLEPLSAMFPNPQTLKLLNLLGAIFLIPIIFSLPYLIPRKLPEVIFYALIGLICFVAPQHLPVFILVGFFLIVDVLSDFESLSLNFNIFGTLIIIVILHLFLFLSPFGFKLNPNIRGEIGPDLFPLLTYQEKIMQFANHEAGELAWKQILELNEADFQVLKKHPKLWMQETSGEWVFSESGVPPPNSGINPKRKLDNSHQ